MDQLIDNSRKTENEPEVLEGKKVSKISYFGKIIISSLIVIIICLITALILVIVLKNKNNDGENKDRGDNGGGDDENEELIKAGFVESWNDLYGIKLENLSYVDDELIPNSFKINGSNYKEDIGNVNNGKDYPKNERNIYTLYIPYSALKRNNKYNGVFLFIHGGSWIRGHKEDVEYFCTRYAKMGYITANFEYTLMSGEYPEYNIYRILDEVTACINSIRAQLESFGFNGYKLELAIGGLSAGGHIASLYGYSIKQTIIPLKFIINMVGPLSPEPEYWYTLTIKNDTLEDLEPETIENAIKEGKLKKVFPDSMFITIMNMFLGNKYTPEEEKEMIKDDKIDENNPKYQEMFRSVQYSIATKFIDNKTVPTLCIYGGADSLVGVGMYRFLKTISKPFGNKIDLIYMRYAEHELINYYTENGIQAMRDFHYQVLQYAETYFTSEK